MQQNQLQKKVPQQFLSNTGMLVSKLGLGCMGLSNTITTPGLKTHEEAVDLIGKALDQGINFYDSAYIYGDNEKILAKAIKKYGREKFFIASKVPPFVIDENGEMQKISGTPENTKKYCELSLERLQIDYIDLYYLHRIDPEIPIETQAQGFKQLINSGKIMFYGISEASEDTIRRAHKVHPLTAVQEEYSLFTRDVEVNGVLKATKELGIALVCYCPLGRGILTGNLGMEKDDWRKTQPRFQGDNFEKNQKLVEQMKELARSIKITPGQLALSWLMSKSSNIFPIPGTKREKYLTENNQSTHVKLSPDIIKKLDEMFPYQAIAGDRYSEEFGKLSNITTPKLK